MSGSGGVGYLARSRAALGNAAQDHAGLVLEHGHKGVAHLGLDCLPQHPPVKRSCLVFLHPITRPMQSTLLLNC